MNNKTSNNIKTLGILGGGQLGRMSAQAATKLGIKTVIYTDSENGPASQVANKTYVGGYTDKDNLAKFANDVDVISYEFENIPVETIQFLKTLTPVFPDEKLLETSQHRVTEKSFLNDIGIPTAKWASIKNAQNAEKLIQGWDSSSCIVKTCRFGYDGKGQAKFNKGDNLDQFETDDLIAEEIIDFDFEVSVIVARDKHNKCVFYGPLHNEHKNHILDITTSPASNVSDELAAEARGMAQTIAEEVNLQGLLTLELFVTKSGEILANEIAPRTHNSGHYSMDACETSQFENHVRAVCNMDVEEPNQHSHAKMINLIGDDVNDLGKYLDMDNATVHLYGKHDVKTGRKMGHVNIIGEKL